MANATYALISSQVLGSNSATVTFSSIPGTYKDLVLIINARDTFNSTFLNYTFQVNLDTTTNYSYTTEYAYNNAGNSGNNGATNGMIFSLIGAAAPANLFSNNQIYISNYAAATTKQIISKGGSEDTVGNGGFTGIIAGLYKGTSAITTITLTATSNFLTGSSFYLYGIKNS